MCVCDGTTKDEREMNSVVVANEVTDTVTENGSAGAKKSNPTSPTISLRKRHRIGGRKQSRGGGVPKLTRYQFLAWIGLMALAVFQLIQVNYFESHHHTFYSFNNSNNRYKDHSLSPIKQRLQQNFRLPTRTSILHQQRNQQHKGSHSFSTDNNASSSYTPPPPFQWNDQGCQDWLPHSKLSNSNNNNNNSSSSSSSTKPTGLVVTLILAPDEPSYLSVTQSLVCHAIPSQMYYLIGPQQWDFLLIISGESLHAQFPLQYLLKCLQLRPATTTQQQQDDEPQLLQKTWTNLDGTKLTTTEYITQWNTSFYIARTNISWPRFIQKDPSILNKTIKPPTCNAPKSYIQGTRWYSNELLHLRILQEYDYFIKLDTDMYFIRSPPMDILHDIRQRNAVLGHTAKMPNTSGKQCATGIRAALKDFWEARRKGNKETTTSVDGGTSNSVDYYPEWRHDYCSPDRWEIQQDRDLFYTNFIIGRVDFWTQPLVRDLARFLSNHPKGFFEYRWTDQIFWHYAMGLLLMGHGNGFLDYTADYTELRCSPEINCWMAIFSPMLYGKTSFQRCDNNATFLHIKAPNYYWNRTRPLTYEQLWRRSNDAADDTTTRATTWNTTYRHECPLRTERRKQEVFDLQIKKLDDPTYGPPLTTKNLTKLTRPKPKKLGNIG